MIVRNWHALNWETDEQIVRKRSVDKRGAKSDEAYVRDVLGEMAAARNLLVINDEAHHAWRVPAESKVKGVAKADIEEATKWVGGLDQDSPSEENPHLLRLLGHTIRPVRQAKLGRGLVRLDSQRLRAERRD